MIESTLSAKIYDAIFPVFGGLTGGIAGWAQAHPYVDTAVTALIFATTGAIVGYGMKYLLDWITGKNKKGKDKKRE